MHRLTIRQRVLKKSPLTTADRCGRLLNPTSTQPRLSPLHLRLRPTRHHQPTTSYPHSTPVRPPRPLCRLAAPPQHRVNAKSSSDESPRTKPSNLHLVRTCSMCWVGSWRRAVLGIWCCSRISDSRKGPRTVSRTSGGWCGVKRGRRSCSRHRLKWKFLRRFMQRVY